MHNYFKFIEEQTAINDQCCIDTILPAIEHLMDYNCSEDLEYLSSIENQIRISNNHD